MFLRQEFACWVQEISRSEWLKHSSEKEVAMSWSRESLVNFPKYLVYYSERAQESLEDLEESCDRSDKFSKIHCGFSIENTQKEQNRQRRHIAVFRQGLMESWNNTIYFKGRANNTS